MDTYTLEVCGLKRQLPMVPIQDGQTAFASFVILGDTELVRAASLALLEKLPACDLIVCPEAKAIALAYELSRLLHHREFIVARKTVKSYMDNPIKTSVHSITTQGEQFLCLDRNDARKIEGKRICIVDDVISTGESLAAVERLVAEARGNIVAKVAVLAEGDASKRDDIIYLEKLPLFKKTEHGWIAQ